MAKAADNQSDWIEWAGGECPVEPTAEVFRMYRGSAPDHTTTAGPAEHYYWGHTGLPEDIIAYRIVRS